MLVKFTPGPRNFKIGDAVVIICHGMATLGGDHRVVKVTKTHAHVKVPHYNKPSLVCLATSQTKDWGRAGVMLQSEAHEQAADYANGKRERLDNNPTKPGYNLFWGQGAI